MSDEIGKFDWVVQWLMKAPSATDPSSIPMFAYTEVYPQRLFPINYETFPYPLVWSTITLNRFETHITGSYEMKPRTLKACMGIIKRVFIGMWMMERMRLRIYNMVTGEEIPMEVFS